MALFSTAPPPSAATKLTVASKVRAASLSKGLGVKVQAAKGAKLKIVVKDGREGRRARERDRQARRHDDGQGQGGPPAEGGQGDAHADRVRHRAGHRREDRVAADQRLIVNSSPSAAATAPAVLTAPQPPCSHANDAPAEPVTAPAK